MWVTRQDLLYCYRSARRAPLLSLAAVTALAVGIGLNAGVFTLLNSIFLEPPASNAPSGYVQVYPRYEGWLVLRSPNLRPGVLARITAKSPLPLQRFDPLVYGIAAALLIIVSLLAMSLPAMRATQVDPVDALRTE